MGRLDGKVAIITGAASGIGETTAQTFAREGAMVVGTDVQEDKLKKVITNINNEYGDVAIAVKHNVSDEGDWKNVVEEAVNKFGKVNVLVNNAGIQGTEYTFEDSSLDEWNKIMNINSTGTFLGIKTVSSEMKKHNERSSIINISSMAALVGTVEGSTAAYTAAKGAVRSLTKRAAVQLGESNICVNSVHPGVILTPAAEEVLDEEGKKHMAAKSPLNKIGEPKDVANLSLFLASDESKFMTGSELVVDGGWLANGDL